MFSIPTASSDLRKEIELQNKRMEEMKLVQPSFNEDEEDSKVNSKTTAT